jgi:signal peptidase II
LKKIIKDYLVLALVAVPIVLLDQWSKAFVRSSLPMGAIWSPWEWLTPYARIVHWQNTGVAFGMFQGQSLIFAILAVIVSAVIIYYYPRVAQEDWILRLALGLQLAGALGNLVDRITVGYVTDFISVGTFPVFNVADSSISVGVVVLLISVWLQERRDKKNISNPDLEPVEETLARKE